MKLARDDWHLLTGSYAVDALTDQEREGFERHLHRCVSCDAEVRGLRETAARLALARSLRPPPGLKDPVLAATCRTSQLPPPEASARPFRFRPPRFRPPRFRPPRFRPPRLRPPRLRPFRLRPPRLFTARLAAALRRTAGLSLSPVSRRAQAVPAVVREKALAAGAAQWLDDLPGLIEGLERDWSIRVGRPYQDSTEAFVARATLDDKTPAVLKLMVPRATEAARHEITALRLAAGEGCVRLLQADEARGALLLERLGRSLHELALSIEQRHEILCSAAAHIWRPAPGAGLPTGADKGRWLAGHIETTWAELGQPCTERAVAHALACAARRVAAHDDERAVLVHGDVHEWNALEAPGGGFKLVDPDGLLAEPEYDLGVMMREDPVELMHGDPRQRARWLARRCGQDAQAIWEWGVAERVSTGLLATRIGLQPVGRQMLAAADKLAGEPRPVR